METKAYALPPLVRLTDETGSGLWPTPRANENDQGPANRKAIAQAGSSWKGQGRGATLHTMAKMWPTPTSRDWKDGSAQACANVPANNLLGREIHWRTPQARDGMERGPSDPQRRMEQGHSVSLHDQIGGALNPTWVEWLMGLPPGWTDTG